LRFDEHTTLRTWSVHIKTLKLKKGDFKSAPLKAFIETRL